MGKASAKKRKNSGQNNDCDSLMDKIRIELEKMDIEKLTSFSLHVAKKYPTVSLLKQPHQATPSDQP